MKVKKLPYICCKVGGDCNLFAIKKGNDRFDRCKRNDCTTCMHCKVNDEQDMKMKKQFHLDAVVDACKHWCGTWKTLHDNLPEGEVQCFHGHDDNNNEVFAAINL